MRMRSTYRKDISLQTLLLLFKYANHKNKRPFVSTANEALVGTLMTIGDVNNILPIVATGQRQTKGYHNRNHHKQTIIPSFCNKGGEIHYIQGKQRFQQPSFIKDTESGCCTVR